MNTTDTTPPTFDCKRRRHKVITADAICVLCGARNVIDARRLPPLPTPAQPLNVDAHGERPNPTHAGTSDEEPPNTKRHEGEHSWPTGPPTDAAPAPESPSRSDEHDAEHAPHTPRDTTRDE